MKLANQIRNLNDKLLVKRALHVQMLDDMKGHYSWVIICAVGEEVVKITKEASRDKFQMRF